MKNNNVPALILCCILIFVVIMAGGEKSAAECTRKSISLPPLLDTRFDPRIRNLESYSDEYSTDLTTMPYHKNNGYFKSKKYIQSEESWAVDYRIITILKYYFESADDASEFPYSILFPGQPALPPDWAKSDEELPPWARRKSGLIGDKTIWRANSRVFFVKGKCCVIIYVDPSNGFEYTKKIAKIVERKQ